MFDYQFLEDFGMNGGGADDQRLVCVFLLPQALLCKWYTGILNVQYLGYRISNINERLLALLMH